MAGMFTVGEVKVRPGAYSNIQKIDEASTVGATDGVVAVLFQSDWGPLGKAVELSVEEGYEDIFGNALTTDAIKEAIAGGAKTLICCRVGSAGQNAEVTLKDEDGEDAIKLTAKYVGAKAFSVSVRDTLSDAAQRECIIYAGSRVFERVTFAKGGDEVDALAEALGTSANFYVQKADDAAGELATVSQSEFTAGSNPTVTAEDYSDGLDAVEPYFFNTICVDTESADIHNLVAAFLDRVKEYGQFAMAVVAEDTAVDFETRMSHAAAFNSEKVVYVVNPHVLTSTGEMKGYQTAARIAGMIAAIPASTSLTHTVVTGVTDLGEAIKPTQITKAETMGCLVLTKNKSGQIWIDSAINTLITPSDDQDDGWKKIRRTKTRYELLERAVTQADNLVGKVNNDTNGRATIISQIQSVVDAMIGEGKLSSGIVSESTKNPAVGDSCWFEINAVDKDSAEKVYLSFIFRYATE